MTTVTATTYCVPTRCQQQCPPIRTSPSHTQAGSVTYIPLGVTWHTQAKAAGFQSRSPGCPMEQGAAWPHPAPRCKRLRQGRVHMECSRIQCSTSTSRSPSGWTRRLALELRTTVTGILATRAGRGQQWSLDRGARLSHKGQLREWDASPTVAPCVK